MRRIASVVLACALSALTWCRTVQQAESAAADVLIPPSQEKELGAQMRPQIESQLKLSSDPELAAYVQRVGQRVAAASPNPDKWQFTFKVIDDPKTVNAFATPGGTIYVYTGLLKAAKDESEVAGVLAHEVAHVTQRHIAQRMVGQFGLETVAGLALGKNPSMLQQISASIVANGLLLKNSRDDEAQADSKGVVATHQAGYDPNGLVSFFQTLKASEGKTPGVLAWLSDHPTTDDRIRSMQAEIRKKNLVGGERNATALQAIQGRIG